MCDLIWTYFVLQIFDIRYRQLLVDGVTGASGRSAQSHADQGDRREVVFVTTHNRCTEATVVMEKQLIIGLVLIPHAQESII